MPVSRPHPGARTPLGPTTCSGPRPLGRGGMCVWVTGRPRAQLAAWSPGGFRATLESRASPSSSSVPQAAETFRCLTRLCEETKTLPLPTPQQGWSRAKHAAGSRCPVPQASPTRRDGERIAAPRGPAVVPSGTARSDPAGGVPGTSAPPPGRPANGHRRPRRFPATVAGRGGKRRCPLPAPQPPSPAPLGARRAAPASARPRASFPARALRSPKAGLSPAGTAPGGAGHLGRERLGKAVSARSGGSSDEERCACACARACACVSAVRAQGRAGQGRRRSGCGGASLSLPALRSEAAATELIICRPGFSTRASLSLVYTSDSQRDPLAVGGVRGHLPHASRVD